MNLRKHFNFCFIMAENEGIIAMYDSQWTDVLLIKETDLERIISYINSSSVQTTPKNGYNYIKTYSIGTIDVADYQQDFEHNILPFQDLIPPSQNLNGEESKICFSITKSCRLSFIDFSDKPDGNYEYIMILQDEDTKFAILKALTSLESTEIYNCLIELFCLIGVPAKIITSEKSKMKPILEEFYYFNENFDIKVEMPTNEDDEDLDIQQLKNLIEDWMERNNSNEWHCGLYFIQYQSNCSYNASINGYPFDVLLKPNYEYVKREYTRYLLHKPQIIDKFANNDVKSTKSDLETNAERENGGIDEFYLAIEPKSNEDLKYEEIDSLIQILDKTNADKPPSDKDPGAVHNKRVIVYKRNSKQTRGPTPNVLAKLEPVNIDKSNNKRDWVCKLREINFVDGTEYGSNESSEKKKNEWTNKPADLGNTQDHVLELKSPSLEDTDIPIKARRLREHKLVKTIRSELRNVPPDKPTAICLVCRKKKKTHSSLSNANIGAPVRLRTSITDRRQKACPNFILAVIVDITSDGQYRIGTPKGVLKDSYPSEVLMDCNHTLFTLKDIPKNKCIEVTEAIKGQLKLNHKELTKCNCARQHGYCNPKFSYHNRCLVHETYTEKIRTLK